MKSRFRCSSWTAAATENDRSAIGRRAPPNARRLTFYRSDPNHFSTHQSPSPRRAGGSWPASLKETSTLSIAVPTGGATSPSSSTSALTFSPAATSSSSSPVFHSTTSSGKRSEPKLLPSSALRQATRRTFSPQFAITGFENTKKSLPNLIFLFSALTSEHQSFPIHSLYTGCPTCFLSRSSTFFCLGRTRHDLLSSVEMRNSRFPIVHFLLLYHRSFIVTLMAKLLAA